MKLAYTMLFTTLLVGALCFDNSTQARSREYNVNGWNNIVISGLVLGQTSGDTYFMLTDETANQCAVIRENKVGTEVWAKLFSRGRCTGLAVDKNETLLYFTDYDDSLNSMGLTQVSAADGSSNAYFTTTAFEVDMNILSISVSDSADTLYMTGSVDSTSTDNDNLWKWSVTSNTIECSEWVGNAFTDGVDLYSNSDEWLFVMVRDVGIVHKPSMINITDSTVMWSKTINVTTGLAYAANAYSDYDGTNIHCGIPFSVLGYGLFVILEQSSGNIVNSMKQVSSSNTLIMQSLHVDSNMMTWINSWVLDSPFICELIKYDKSTDTFINYQTTNAVFVNQIVTGNNNYWYGGRLANQISESLLSNRDLFPTSVTVTTSSGLSDANSTHTIVSGSLNAPSFVSSVLTTSSTNPDSALNYTRMDTIYSKSKDDGLSDGEIAAIVIGSLAGVVIIGLGITILVIIAMKKKWCCFKKATMNDHHKNEQNSASSNQNQNQNL